MPAASRRKRSRTAPSASPTSLLAQYPDQQPEISFQADPASLAMRRYLKRQAEGETAPAGKPAAA